MRIIKVELDKLDKTVLNIGWEGEQNHVQVQIQCGAFFAKYPNAGAGLTVLSPANVTYPVVLGKEGNDLIWDIDASDVVTAGSGKIQLTFTDGTGDDAEVIKTVIGSFNVNASLAVDGTAPDPIQHWIDQAEQTARQIAEESAIYAKEEIVESYGSIAPAIIETASGEIASISDGADGMLVKKLTVDIDPVQDLHGYDNPWPAGGGKNLLPPLSAETKNGVTITVADDGTITINGTATEDTYFDKYFDASYNQGDAVHICGFNPSAGDSRLTIFIIGSAGNDQVNLSSVNAVTSTTASADNTISRWRLRVPNGLTLTNFVAKPMLQIGGTAPTSYSPYSNICPISGWESANVSRTGKNLLNKSDGETSASNWWIGSNAVNAEPDGTFVLNAGTYTLSISEAQTGIYVRKNGSNIITVYNNTKATFTLTEKTPVRLMLYKNNITIDYWDTIDIQLELGSTASEYTPYSGSTNEYEFPQEAKPVYGGSLTIHQDGTGVLTVDKELADLGNTNWNVDSKRPGVFYGSIVGRKSSSNIFACSEYECYNNSVTTLKDSYISGEFSYGGGYVFVRDTRYASSTSSAFKTAVAGIKAVYELATPVTYQLTNQQVLTLLKGNNVCFADCGSVSIEYPADTKLYIDGKVAELQALILENISNS